MFDALPPAPVADPLWSVLLIEDDPSLRQVLEIFLQQFGCQVRSEGDGLQALNHLKTLAQPPNLILTDLSLPGMDGLALLKAARELYPRLPVILLTGFHKETVNTSDLEPDAVLEKPILLQDLKKVVAALLENTS